MRVVAIILLFITLFVGVYFGYCYIGLAMQIESVTAEWVTVDDDMEKFVHIERQIEEGFFSGNLYAEPPLPGASEAAFLTLTVRMSNKGLLDQDWIEIHVTPREGDIALLAQERTPTLAANTRADFSVTLLTRPGAEEQRDIRISYYVLGRKYEVAYGI